MLQEHEGAMRRSKLARRKEINGEGKACHWNM